MRPMVSRFAVRMDRQLDQAIRDGKKEQGWHAAWAFGLIDSAERHIRQLRDSLRPLGTVSLGEEQELRARIAHEAADAANYLGMVADNAELGRGLVGGDHGPTDLQGG